VASLEDVRALATALPEVTERTARQGAPEWRVRDRTFVWERPLRARDLEELGDAAPADDPLGAYVPDLVAKEALLASDPVTYLTTGHFDGYPIVLVRLDRIAPDELEELVVEAWYARAPKRLADELTRIRR
jgi:hypothetical protein